MHYYLHIRLLFMRTSIFIVLLNICSTLIANPSKGQLLETKVTVEKPTSSLLGLINELEEQFIPLVYDRELIASASQSQKTKNFINRPLKEVLSYTLKNSTITFKETAGYILLERKKQQHGRLIGRILDNWGKPLSKANIHVLGTNYKIESSVDGSYALSLPTGTYKVQVSHISKQTQEIASVEVKAGESTKLDVAMIDRSSKIEEVRVETTFKKASTAGLYAAQKNAVTVTDGISAEQIARTPDNDVGQVLKRITGLTTVNNRSVIVRGMSDRYNQAMLDGIPLPSTSQFKRDFAFDIIPVEMVSSVVVNKTASPELSAEFSGGQVTINTLDIPDANFTLFQYGSGTTSQLVGKDFLRLGQRSTSEYFGLPSKSAQQPKDIFVWNTHTEAIREDAIPLGEKTNEKARDLMLNYRHNNLTYKDLDAIEQSKKLNPDGFKSYRYGANPNQNIRMTLGRVYDLRNNSRFGFSLSGNFRNEQNIVEFNNVRGTIGLQNFMDSVGFGKRGPGQSYRFNSNSSVVANVGYQTTRFKASLKNMYARTYADHFNQITRLYYGDLTPPIDNRSNLIREQYQQPEAMSLQQHQLNTEVSLPWGIKSDVMFTINKIKQQILDEKRMRYNVTTKIGDTYYFQNPNLFRYAASTNVTEKYDYRMWTNINQRDLNWAASFSKSFKISDFLENTMKIGYQGVNKFRSLDVLEMLPATRSYDENPSNSNRSAPRIMTNYAELMKPENLGNGNGQAYYYAMNTGGRISSGGMNNHSAYIMLDQKLWDKLRLVYGARLEFFDLENRQHQQILSLYGPDALNDPKYAYRLTVGDKQTRILPSINLTYQITDNFNFRTSFSRTAIRPDFRETGMFAFYSFDINGYIGGEQVVSTIVENTDIRLEWYPGPGEIISVTGYYKYLDKPIELVQGERHRNLYKYANMESATNMGLEMEIRKNFGFLSEKPWLNNLFIYANGTVLKSHVNALSAYNWINPPGETTAVRMQQRVPSQDRPLMGQSPWLLNLGFGYWGDKFGATANYNHRGYRTNLGNIDMSRVEFELAPRQLDFQLYGRFLKKKLEMKFNIANLLNDWTRFYRNNLYYSPGEIADQKERGNTVESKGDVRYNKKDGDIILYQSREGVRYNLSLTYSF